MSRNLTSRMPDQDYADIICTQVDQMMLAVTHLRDLQILLDRMTGTDFDNIQAELVNQLGVIAEVLEA